MWRLQSHRWAHPSRIPSLPSASVFGWVGLGESDSTTITVPQGSSRNMTSCSFCFLGFHFLSDGEKSGCWSSCRTNDLWLPFHFTSLAFPAPLMLLKVTGQTEDRQTVLCLSWGRTDLATGRQTTGAIGLTVSETQNFGLEATVLLHPSDAFCLLICWKLSLRSQGIWASYGHSNKLSQTSCVFKKTPVFYPFWRSESKMTFTGMTSSHPQDCDPSGDYGESSFPGLFHLLEAICIPWTMAPSSIFKASHVASFNLSVPPASLF